MARFKPHDPRQHSLLVINYQNQPQSGTFEHAIHYLIEYELDLSPFHSRYNNDRTGRL